MKITIKYSESKLSPKKTEGYDKIGIVFDDEKGFKFNTRIDLQDTEYFNFFDFYKHISKLVKNEIEFAIKLKPKSEKKIKKRIK